MSENPACLHKTPGAWKTRVGWACPDCGMIRHRFATLELVPISEHDGLTVLTDVVVPLGVSLR